MNQEQFNHWQIDPNRRPLVMGVLNVTPDSFSDGGKFFSTSGAVAQAHQMVEAGADWLDIGGESTRPGSQPVDAAEQIRRVVPVLRAITDASLSAILSIDTTSSAVAEAALDARASIVNDISAGLFDPQMFSLVAARGASIILMHMQGTPATMQRDPRYADVVAEVTEFLRARCDVGKRAGIASSKIVIDPGIGFGKTVEHNLVLLQQIGTLARDLGHPLVVGPSRKGFIGAITGEPDASRRQFGTAACVAWSISQGASVVRVHDVGPMYQVVQMVRAIVTGKPEAADVTSGDLRSHEKRTTPPPTI
jgi:dihydropteroate synthase